MPANGYSKTNTSERVSKRADCSNLKFCCLIILCLGCIAILFMLMYLYWAWVMDDRDEKDNYLTVISEPLRDHTTGTYVECYCYEGKSCRNWTCSYVREHFHRIPHECRYNDLYDEIKIIIDILLVISLCAFCFGSKKPSS